MSRRAVGTPVFGGMIAASLFGIFVIPVLYVAFQWLRERTARPSVEEAVPELERERSPVSSLGDLWQLGSHLLLCGSALEDASYAKLMSDQRAQMVFTDPPYNVKIEGHAAVSGRSIIELLRWQPGRCRRSNLPIF